MEVATASWGAAETRTQAPSSLNDGVYVARIDASIFQLVTLDGAWTGAARRNYSKELEEVTRSGRWRRCWLALRTRLRRYFRDDYSRLRSKRESSDDMSHLPQCGIGLIEMGLGLGYGGLGLPLLVDGVQRVGSPPRRAV